MIQISKSVQKQKTGSNYRNWIKVILLFIQRPDQKYVKKIYFHWKDWNTNQLSTTKAVEGLGTNDESEQSWRIFSSDWLGSRGTKYNIIYYIVPSPSTANHQHLLNKLFILVHSVVGPTRPAFLSSTRFRKSLISLFVKTCLIPHSSRCSKPVALLPKRESLCTKLNHLSH